MKLSKTYSLLLPFTLMILDDWILVNVIGKDVKKYMQGQVTADIFQINTYQHLLVGHCNPQGKILSSLCLFQRNQGFSFIERRSVKDVQITELKKYSIFSKVTIFCDYDFCLLGVAGLHSRLVLQDLFEKLPCEKTPLVHDKTSSFLWFKYPEERFLLIVDRKTKNRIFQKLSNNICPNGNKIWLALDIIAGIPIIDFPNIGKYFPQEINLQKLGGVSFKKGCYIGQEVIAKIKARSIEKKTLCCLVGNSNRIPEIGENLELRIDKNWRRSGNILAISHLPDINHVLIQAVINNDLKIDDVFRVKNDTHVLKIQPLPYL